VMFDVVENWSTSSTGYHHTSDILEYWSTMTILKRTSTRKCNPSWNGTDSDNVTDLESAQRSDFAGFQSQPLAGGVNDQVRV
jgi:hypothetical protein